MAEPASDAAPEAKPGPISDEAMLARFQGARSRPPASETLGFEMVRIDQAALEIEVAFTALPAFCNPMGQVQGGFLMAMLDETMSVAGVVASNMTAFMPTLEQKTSFLRPAFPGRLTCVARVVKWGRSIAFSEASLFDAQGRLLARSTATAMPTPFKAARAKTL